MDKIAAAKKKKTRTIWLRTLSAAACLALIVFAYANSGSGGQNNTDGADSSVILNSGNETVNSPVSEDMSGRSMPQQSKLSSVPLYTVQNAAEAEALAELLKPNDENKQPPSDMAPVAELLLTPSGLDESESVLLYFDGHDTFADTGSGIYHVIGTAAEFESIIENINSKKASREGCFLAVYMILSHSSVVWVNQTVMAENTAAAKARVSGVPKKSEATTLITPHSTASSTSFCEREALFLTSRISAAAAASTAMICAA